MKTPLNLKIVKRVSLGLMLSSSLVGCRCPHVALPSWPWKMHPPVTHDSPAVTPTPAESFPPLAPPSEPEAPVPENSPTPDPAPSPLPAPLLTPPAKSIEKKGGTKPDKQAKGSEHLAEPRPLSTAIVPRSWMGSLRKKVVTGDTESIPEEMVTSEPHSKSTTSSTGTVSKRGKYDAWSSDAAVTLPNTPPHLTAPKTRQPATSSTGSTGGGDLLPPEPIHRRSNTSEIPQGHSRPEDVVTPRASDGPSFLPSPAPYPSSNSR